MKKFLIALVSMIGLSTTQLKAEECQTCVGCNSSTYYAKVLSGVNFIDSDTTRYLKPNFYSGYIVSGAFGYKTHRGMAFEVEYAYRHNELKGLKIFGRNFELNGHVQSSSYMANTFIDLPLYALGLQPYIGGGVGYEVQQVHARKYNITVRDHTHGFAWQLMAGLYFPVLRQSDMSIEYRFHQGPFTRLYSHSAVIALSYNFY